MWKISLEINERLAFLNPKGALRIKKESTINTHHFIPYLFGGSVLCTETSPETFKSLFLVLLTLKHISKTFHHVI